MRRTNDDTSAPQPNTKQALAVLDLPLERDAFLRTLLRHLSGTLQDVVGIEEASGFISVVGQEMGEEIGDIYRRAFSLEQLRPDQLADVLVDLKRRINGDFYVIEQTEDKIVFGNRICPFGDRVTDRPALCMMTSNVFGAISAREFGYAKVELQKTIARRHPECRVVVYLRPSVDADAADGRVYHRGAGQH